MHVSARLFASVNSVIMTDNNDEMTCFKRSMMNQFEMSDLSILSYFLGIELEMKS
jgi:hypothetical protein